MHNCVWFHTKSKKFQAFRFLRLKVKVKVKVKQSLYRPGQTLRVEVPRFQDNRHMMLVRLSALHTGRL